MYLFCIRKISFVVKVTQPKLQFLAANIDSSTFIKTGTADGGF